MIRIDLPGIIRDRIERLKLFESPRMPQSWREVRPKDVITSEYINDLIQHGGAKDTGHPHPRGDAGALKFPFYYSQSMPEFHNDAGEYPKEYQHLKALPYKKVVRHADYRDAITKVSLEHFKWARKRFQEEMRMVSGNIVGYRAISLTPDMISNIRNGGDLGIYWTFDQDSYSGQQYWSKTVDGIVMMSALIPESSVNWITTYVQNMDWFQGMSECELRLIPGSSIKLLKVFPSEGKPILAHKNGSWTA